jgi:hypothetical protein
MLVYNIKRSINILGGSDCQTQKWNSQGKSLVLLKQVYKAAIRLHFYQTKFAA